MNEGECPNCKQVAPRHTEGWLRKRRLVCSLCGYVIVQIKLNSEGEVIETIYGEQPKSKLKDALTFSRMK